MKRKTIVCAIALTALVMGGCGRNNTQNNENVTTPDTTVPNSSAAESAVPEDHAAGSDVSDSTVSDSALPSENGTGSDIQHENEDGQNVNNEQTMITEEQAREIALSHAGLAADQVTFIKSGLDWDNGRKNYDVEFYTADNKEFDYEINPYTGEVLDYDYDAEYYGESSITHDGDTISSDKAKQIALEKVPGAAEKDIKKFKSDYDNGRLEYEGKIYYEQKEYEFEIDGHSGEILEWDEETIHNAS